ncbi:MAG TPA: hypothetical protein VHI10_12680, partial [Mycobacterium sp.]|nr:hypothetical protein [Mycobacterium sp.]
MTPVRVASGLVSSLLGSVGVAPSAAPTGPVAPAPSLALVAALAAVRREQQQALLDQTPAIAIASIQTSQTQTGLLGGLLHLLFNNSPTINYNPAENSQL